MAANKNGPPTLDTLQTGDLLFPRANDGWVPYLRGAANQTTAYGAEEKEWLKLREQITGGKGKIPDEARKKIATMSYDEFRAQYGGGGNPALFGVHFYTGRGQLLRLHVGYRFVPRPNLERYSGIRVS